MKKSGANDNRCGSGIGSHFLLALLLIASTGRAAAVELGRWPRATYYTVVARSGDNVVTIAGRYHVPASLIGKLNGLNGSANVAAGTTVLIPAATRSTRYAVLYEATDRSAPNYATRPKLVAGANFSVAPPVRVLNPASSPHHHAAKGILIARASQRKGLRFSWPISGPVISAFGPGAHGMRNEGINIAAERGAPFRAAADGTVSYAGPLRGYGNLILITHGQSYVTAYAHADNIAVTQGEAVEMGQVIGTAGTSGGVDRPQLHFEIRHGVAPVDPSLLLAAAS